MRFIRGTFNLDKLLVDAMNLYRELLSEDRQADKSAQRRSFVQRFVGEGRKMMNLNIASEPTKGITQQYTGHNHTTIFDAQVRFLEYEAKDLIPPVTKSKYALDTLAFPEEITGLVDELKHWKESEKWYKERDIQWRRGWLLHGPPGNGKTSLVRALAQDMNMPVFTFDLGSMSNQEFVKFWGLMIPYAPAIALLEDVDAVFHGRTNILGEQGGGLTFDCLLNMLGGIDNNNGIFTVITTNNPDLLDPALGAPRDDNMSSRPGRIDRAIFLDNPDFDCRKRIILKILRDMEEPDLSDLAEQCDGMSSAQVQEQCMEIALGQLWRAGKGLPQANGHTSNALAFIK
jgi:SpoVK/Ycf46/Vps4 family AAA+-type ATPase